jgi:hypothetical protein
MESWLVLQSFYNGLTPMSRGHLDAAAGGAFMSLTINEATTLIEKMVTNQGWGEDRAPAKTQRHAYHEGGGYACRKNGLAPQEV